MFVTNLTNSPLGVDGIVILQPKAEMIFVEDTVDLTDRVSRLKLANLVTVSYEEGLVKTGFVEAEVPVVAEVAPAVVEAPAKTKRGAKVEADKPE